MPTLEFEAQREDTARYRTYDNGETIAYAREREGPRDGLWAASLWSKHPLDNDDAKHIRHLCVDSTWRNMWNEIRAYETS